MRRILFRREVDIALLFTGIALFIILLSSTRVIEESMILVEDSIESIDGEYTLEIWLTGYEVPPVVSLMIEARSRMGVFNLILLDEANYLKYIRGGEYEYTLYFRDIDVLSYKLEYVSLVELNGSRLILSTNGDGGIDVYLRIEAYWHERSFIGIFDNLIVRIILMAISLTLIGLAALSGAMKWYRLSLLYTASSLSYSQSSSNTLIGSP